MSAVQQIGGPFQLVTAAAIAVYRGVKVSAAGLATLWAAGDTYPSLIGVAIDTYASGATGAFAPVQKGIMWMMAGAAIAANANVYPAANGKISSTAASGSIIGVALDAASGDGSVIRVAVQY